MSRITPPPSERDIPEILRNNGPIFGPSIQLDLSSAPAARGPDFFASLSWQGTEFRFAAEAKKNNDPRVLEDALRQARLWASQSGLLPMVIVPYLGPKRLDRLEQELVSGLDLCGNGIIIVSGKLLLRSSGKSNRFRERRSESLAYRGTASLVPRAFFRRPVYFSVNQVKQEIEENGGAISLPTVSRTLSALEQDLVIDRSGDQIVLLQPDALIDRLAENYKTIEPSRIKRVKLRASEREIAERLDPKYDQVLVRSGASSTENYTAGMRADLPIYYTKNLNDLEDAAGNLWQATDRFFNATILETSSPLPFFDTRPVAEGIPMASPVQTYLELVTGKEHRDLALASDVRATLLQSLSKWKPQLP